MRDTMVWRYTLYVFLLLAIHDVLTTQTGHTVWLDADTDYIYKYDGLTYIKDVARIKVSAQVGAVFAVRLVF